MSLNLGDLFATMTLKDNLSPALAKAAQGLDKFGTGARQAGMSMLPFSAALGAAGAIALKTSADFNKTLVIMSSLGGVAKSNLGIVKDSINSLAKETGVGPQALADAMMKISSTTSDANVQLTVLAAAARGSAAGMGEAIDIGGALTAVINSYGKDAPSAARAMDILTQAVKDGGAEAKEFAPHLSSVAPMAAQMGISFEEVAANIATFTKLGVPAGEAFTSLTGVMAAMSKKTDEGAIALARIGMTYQSLTQAVKDKGLAATLTDLTEKFKLKGTPEALFEVFGRVEGLRNVMGTAGQQADDYAKVLDNVKRSSEGVGVATRAYNEIAGTTAHTWAQFTASVAVLRNELGDRLAPSFQKVVDAALPLINAAVKLLEKFGELPQPVQTAVIAVGGFLALLGPGLVALGSMSQGLAVVVSGFSKLGPVLGVASKGFSAAVAAVGGMGPALGIVATGIAAFALTSWLMENTKWGKALASSLGDVINKIQGIDVEKLQQARGNGVGAGLTGQAFTDAIQAADAPGKAKRDAWYASVAAAEAEKKLQKATEESVASVARSLPLRDADIAAKVRATQAAEDLAKASEIMGQSITDPAQVAHVLRVADAMESARAATKRAAEEAAKLRQEAKDLASTWQGGDAEKAGQRTAAALQLIASAADVPKSQLNAIAEAIKRAEEAGIKLGPVATDLVNRWSDMRIAKLEIEEFNQGLKEQQRIAQLLGPTFGDLQKKFQDINSAINQRADGDVGVLSPDQLDRAATELTAVIDGLISTGQRTDSIVGLTERWQEVLAEIVARGGDTGKFLEKGKKDAGETAKSFTEAEKSTLKWKTALEGAVILAGMFSEDMGALVGILGNVQQEFAKISEETDKAKRAIMTFNAIASAAGQIGNVLSKNTNPAIAKMGSTLAGAASGAKLGSAFGVYGAVIGGIGGAIFGFINKSKQLKKELSEMKKSFADSFGGMDALKVKAGEAGVALDDMFKAKSKDALTKAIDEIKLKLETFDEANNALNEAIDKYGITIDELGPKFAQQKLDEQAASLLKDWQLLSAAGVDINTLIGKMGPNLNEYVQTSIKAGASIPMAMKPMVDQLIASGQLLDENGVAFSSAEAAGITFAETLTEGLTRAVDAIEKLVAALTGMPTSTSPINIPVNYDYGSGGGSPSYSDPLYGGFSPVPMATGGIVTRPTYALVGERGPEAVMPLEDLREMMKSGGQGTVIHSTTHVNISDNPFQTFETAEQAKRRILEIVREEEQQATAKLIVGRNA